MPSAADAATEQRLRALTYRDEARLRRHLRRYRGNDSERLEAELTRAEARVERRRAAIPEVTYPPQLPVSAARDELAAAIGAHQVVVVAGETGSGKTTQIPKLCLELGRGVRGTIAHTQPRRIAARTVAERIAEELGVELGEAVGYSVRFADRSGDDTLVRLMTDGLLVAEIGRDPMLRRYDTIIVDEAHERSLNVDFLLGHLRRLIDQRPELKVIITSATIDPGAFARHFADAPVVEVSGRTYPVEVRYRPPEEGVEQPEAIAAAVDELAREGSGDVLVFLSGEREIRDAAEVLEGHLGDRADVLPLYARLSSAEQRRAFTPGPKRRIVLATNVAETSLTVPGIRYVVDTGLARISRYSARLKVQRLPIEPISIASADQRAGRCGRTSDGICVRLYPQEDLEARPRFTDPEILRTSLAAVILQMAAAKLGAIEAFPFLDPPDSRQVRDGIALLTELGALDDAQRLTGIGKRLAQLPVDPRLGRMVLEADRRGCVEEVIVIVAALSIPDVRERPADSRAQADQSHARFADEDSDFVAILNLWGYLRASQTAETGSAFRRRCRKEYLHFLRVREWQDLVGQLRQAAKQAGASLTGRDEAAASAADPPSGAIAEALLSGLLSHVGMRDAEKREYVGARGARFAIFPGSAVAKKPPAWTMVAELVETSRLWGRTAARISPKQIEAQAGHLLKRTYDDPRWDVKQAGVIATERATLYGLPVVAGRAVAYGRIDPELSRAVFIRRALVERDWEAPHAFLVENAARIEEVEALEERMRRRDLLEGEEARVSFLDERIPQHVVSGAHFDRWWRDARRADPDRLTYPRELLLAPGARELLDPKARPSTWRQGELDLALTYAFEPGASHDGITVSVPLAVLPAVRATGFDWLVPAFRLELVTALIRSLPKELRRALVPVPEVAEAVVAGLKPRKGTLRTAVARELEHVRGVTVEADAFDETRLPAYLRMRFAVEDERGQLVSVGVDLDALRAELAPRLQAKLSAAAAPLERTGLTSWALGTLPRGVTLPDTGGAVRGYPTLVDEGETVGIRVLESAEAQAAAMWAGTRRLLALTVPAPSARALLGGLAPSASLALAAAPHASLDALLADVRAAALDSALHDAGGPALCEAAWTKLRGHVAGRLDGLTRRALADVVGVLDAHRAVLDAVAAMPARAELVALRTDVARQAGRLVFAGFVTPAGAVRLPDIARYLRGALLRLQRAPAVLAADADRLTAVAELETALRARVEALPAGTPRPAGLREARWLLEELRIAQFAPSLVLGSAVSVKRVRKALAEG